MILNAIIAETEHAILPAEKLPTIVQVIAGLLAMMNVPIWGKDIVRDLQAIKLAATMIQILA